MRVPTNPGLCLALLLTLALFPPPCPGAEAGSGPATGAPPVVENEAFLDADRPRFTDESSGNYYLCRPWNYDHPRNANRTYPLVVYLHGAGGAGKPVHLSALGWDDSSNAAASVVARAFQAQHPSFVYVPQTSGAWTNATLIAQIERLRSQFRIDARRLYLIGYSMGGSGSYALANAYCDHNGSLFAGIVRLAGQSQTAVREPIARRSSIWLHVGLKDTPLRIQVAREAYGFLRSLHPDAVESRRATEITGHPGSAQTLTVGGVAVARLSEYAEDGHGIGTFPLADPRLLEWLFGQVLR